jgi:hypothetical protein
MPYFLVDLEATIHLTVEVEADSVEQAQERVLEMTESPGLARLDWDEEETRVLQVRDQSGVEILWDTKGPA